MTITPQYKGKRVTSYKFRLLLPATDNGKQTRKSYIWHPLPTLTPAKAAKAAPLVASAWEGCVRAGRDWQAPQSLDELRGLAHALPPESTEPPAEQALTFSRFVHDVWWPLRVDDGEHSPSTVEFYKNLLVNAERWFGPQALTDIKAPDIQLFLNDLRRNHRTPKGKPYKDSSIKHHYNLMRNILRFAERFDYIPKSPISKVDPPKVRREEVDALTTEQADQFFLLIKHCPLELQCLLCLLSTTGLRRGELLGLQWRDIDFRGMEIHVERNVTYTPGSGTRVGPCKTPTSIRDIPTMPGLMALLRALQVDQHKRNPNKMLAQAFLFPSPKSPNAPFAPMAPCTVTRIVKRFMHTNGLPDMSPHDLRHTCATLLLATGADIKSVQTILGHADAATTLRYYVKPDRAQMRKATDQYAAAFGLG